MTPEREAELLRKELRFLEERWRRYRHDLQEIQVGQVRAIVNGLASSHTSFRWYLDKREERARDRLRALGFATPGELRAWTDFARNWLPRVALCWRSSEHRQSTESVFGRGGSVSGRLAAEGLLDFDADGAPVLTEAGRRFLEPQETV